MSTPDNVTPISGDSKPAGSDNVFDLDADLPAIHLRGGIERYGIEAGTLAEPTDEQVSRWRNEVYRALRSTSRPNLPENPTNADVIDALAEHDWSAGTRRQVDAFAILCGATPPHSGTDRKREIPRPTPPEAPTPPGSGPGRAPERADFDDDASFEAAQTSHAERAVAHDEAVAEHQKAKTEHDKKVAKFEKELAEWEGRWDGGYPTRAQIAALPWRVKAWLFGKLSGAFLDPTADPGSGGTTD